jgi:hypothetical protein
MRKKPGSHLNQVGVDLARSVGEIMGGYSKVVTSLKERGYETAIAMGYSVDEQIEELGVLPENVLNEISWPCSFSRVSNICAHNQLCNTFAIGQANLWEQLVKELPDNEKCLIISHGGILELGAIKLSAEESFDKWGEAIGYCEGLRFIYDNSKFYLDEILRVDECDRVIHN